MPKKKNQPENPMENYINSLIDKKLESWDSSIKKEDAEEIVKFLIPELEQLISKVVKNHLHFLFERAIDKLMV